MSLKIDRYESSFIKEISYIIQEEVKDDDIKFVTITGCDITSDLSYAKVFFTVLDDSKKIDTLKALNKASSFIRGQLSERIDIRHTPELKFIYDNSVAYGNRIESILDSIHEKENDE